MRAGRFADAAREYEAWLKSHPESEAVLLALGICYVQMGRQKEAVSTLRKHVALAPRSAAGHAALGVALLDGTRNSEAKAALETALRLDPKLTDAAEALARIHLIEGNAGHAVALLKPLAASSASAETRILLADALIRANRAREAAEILERELSKDPNAEPRAYALTAWANLKAGDERKAAEASERGMRLYPDSEIAAVYLRLPSAFLAERIGERIKRIQESPDVTEMLALGSFLLVADPARKTRAEEIAERLLSHAVELAPDDAFARFSYGRALRLKDSARAVAEWEKALSLRPDADLKMKILSGLASAKSELSDFAGAERAFREAAEINRKLPKPEAHLMIEYARFLQLLERKSEAEALIEEIVSLAPLSPHAHIERAKLLAARGRWDEAADAGEFVLLNAGEDAELLRAAHVLLARAYMRLNKPEKARSHQTWIDSH